MLNLATSRRFKKKIAESRKKASIPEKDASSDKKVDSHVQSDTPVQAEAIDNASAEKNESPTIVQRTENSTQGSEASISKPPQETHEGEAKPAQADEAGNAAETEGRRSDEKRGNSLVQAKSISIKGVLKGEPRKVPVADKEIEEDDQIIKPAPIDPENVVVTEEDIVKSWAEYAEEMNGNRRTYNSLISHKPKMGANGVILVEVSTEVQQEYFTFKVKPGLTRFLQEKIGNIEYNFKITVADAVLTQKKVYTDEDKLEFLMQKNPELEKMRNIFKLDFDK